MRNAAEYNADMYGIASSANSAWSAMRSGYRRVSNRLGWGRRAASSEAPQTKCRPSRSERRGRGGRRTTAARTQSAKPELARARGPRVPALLREDALGHDDLLLSRGEVCSRCERTASEAFPRRRQELKPSEKSISGIDRPVPAALALREAVPHAGTETAVPAAPEDAGHGDEHRRGRAAADPGLDLHVALPPPGLRRALRRGRRRARDAKAAGPSPAGEVSVSVCAGGT